MTAIVPALIGMVLIAVGYFVYSKFIAEKIYQLDPNFETPAHSMRDDVDFTPTNRVVLWGHHFTSVAGAAPIIGPAIAVIWGWLPAFIWVIGGTIFFAGVHDFGAIWASVRNQGRSIGSLTGDVVSLRARTLFMIVIFFLLMMVNAVFAVAISNAFVATPSAVIPVWSAIAVAVVIGVLIYKVKVPLLWPTVVGVIMLYSVIYLGERFPVELPQTFMGLGAAPQWIIILFVYATIASMLPVWLLLQPRDYINGIQLIIGLGLLFGAVFIANPTIVAPMYNTVVPEGTPPLLPLLFVTIACGALSGFHGLVASGTTSKQLNKETDARFVGYLGSSGEGLLALVTIIAVSAGFASLGEWQTVYAEFGGTIGISTFVAGGSQIVSDGTPLPQEFAATLLAVMAILFAATTMDSGVRLQRYIVQEWGTIYKIPVLQNGYIATFAAVAACLALAFGAGGRDGQGGMTIWPLFGTTNQLLAGLTLLVISVMLVKLGRRYIFTLVPMVFVTLMSLAAAVYQLWDLFWRDPNYLLGMVDVVIIIMAVFVLLESQSAFKREKRAAAAVASHGPEVRTVEADRE
jgi:carbon starvation protein